MKAKYNQSYAKVGILLFETEIIFFANDKIFIFDTILHLPTSYLIEENMHFWQIILVLRQQKFKTNLAQNAN